MTILRMKKPKPSPYNVPSTCAVCGKRFLAYYSTGKRAKVCTLPSHKCQKAKRNGKKIPCKVKCCRSQYGRASQSRLLNSAIDSRKLLSRQETAAFIKGSYKLGREEAGLALRFILRTGCRLGECLLLKARDIEPAKGRCSIAKIQTLKRVGRPVRSTFLFNNDPITREVIRHANKLEPDQPLFSVAKRSLQNWMARLLKKVKPDRISLVHLLRHTRASQLVNMGMPLTTVANQLGWSTTAMASVYSHTNADEVGAFLSKLR